MKVDGIELIIERGVARDALSIGMATLVDDKVVHETMALTSAGSEFLIGVLDRDWLIDFGC